MNVQHEQFWPDYLARLPEAERAAGLALVRQIGEGGQGNVLAGLLALHHAGAMAYLDAAEKIARAADAAAPLREVPVDLARRIVSQIDMQGMSNAIAEGLGKSIGTQAIAAAAAAAKAATESLAAGLNALNEVAPAVHGHTLALSEAAKGLGKHADTLVATEAQQRSILQSMAQHAVYHNTGSRRRDWIIVALLAAMVVAPCTWWFRGQFFVPATNEGLQSLINEHGGRLVYATAQNGTLRIAIKGGNEQATDGWQVFSFATPKGLP